MHARKTKFDQGGFTFLEAAASVVILGVLMTLAVPSFKEMAERNKLKGATEHLRANLQLARSEAIKANKQVVLAMKDGESQWCYGFTDVDADSDDNTDECNCEELNQCQQAFDDREFGGVGLVANDFPRSGEGGGSPALIKFSSIGTVESTGELTLTSADTGAVVKSQMNLLGRLVVCSDDLSAYPNCDE